MTAKHLDHALIASHVRTLRETDSVIVDTLEGARSVRASTPDLSTWVGIGKQMGRDVFVLRHLSRKEA